MTGKQRIRNEMSALGLTLTDEEARRFSERICRRLAATEDFRQARCVALYCAMRGEVLLDALVDEWSGKKRIALPVVDGADMQFYFYTGKESLVSGAFGILSPDPENSQPATSNEIDLFVVPGVAFDRACNRLGRGKGYYDRYLSTDGCLGKPLVGLCYGYRLLREQIPVESHDRQMTMVITEDEIIVSQHRQ